MTDARFTVVEVGTQGPQGASATDLTVSTVAATGTTESLAFNRIHDVTMDANCTFTFTGALAAGNTSSMTVILRGAFTPTWPAAVDWAGGVTPTHSAPSVFEFLTVDGGVTVFGFLAGSAFS